MSFHRHALKFSLSRRINGVAVDYRAQTASGCRFFVFFCLEDISHECLCQFALRARRLVQCCVGRSFFQVLHFGNQMMGNPRDTVLCIHLESKVPRKASGRVSWGFDLRSSKDLNGLKCTFVYVEDCCSWIGTTGRLRKGHSWWRWKNLILRGVALWMTSVAAELFSLYGRGVAEQIWKERETIGNRRLYVLQIVSLSVIVAGRFLDCEKEYTNKCKASMGLFIWRLK